jgi:TolB protein
MVQRFDFAAKTVAIIATLLFMFVHATVARAVEIDVNQGQIDPLPIAITAFVGTSPDSAQAGADIAGVIANNLGHSGYFRPLPPESFIEQISNFDQEPRFGDWRQIQAKALVTGQTVMDGGRL